MATQSGATMNDLDFLASIHPSCTGVAMLQHSGLDYSHVMYYSVLITSLSSVTVWIVMGEPSPWCWWTDEYSQKTSSMPDTESDTVKRDGVHEWINAAPTRAERDRRKKYEHEYMYGMGGKL